MAHVKSLRSASVFRMTEKDGPKASERVQSLDRAFLLLERLADAGRPVGISELAEMTDIPLPTIHRLLRFLSNEGYVRQDNSRRYALGLRLIRLGQSASRGLDVWAHGELGGLVEQFEETANLAILQGDLAIYVGQAPSPHTMRMFTEVGRAVSPHCTGVGKAMLAELPDDRILALLKRTRMPAITSHTITSPEAMMADIEQIRQLGYAVDEGEQEPGVRCVAAAVRGLPFPAAVSISGPNSRVTEEKVPLIAPVLIEVAERLRDRFPSSAGQVGFVG